MSDDKPKHSPVVDLDILEQALDERKVRGDRRKRDVSLPPEIDRRSGRDRRNTDQQD